METQASVLEQREMQDVQEEITNCYCCGFESDDFWYALDVKDNLIGLCDSCSAELAHATEIFVKGKLISMKNEKTFQNEQREKKQVPEQMRLV